MTSDRNKTLDILPDGMLVRSEEIGFAVDDLLSCPKCTRRNSPDRSSCIYCGAALDDSSAKRLQVDDDALEAWEKGFNVAVRVSSEAITNLSGLLGIEPEMLNPIANERSYLPASRLRHEQEAASIVENLNASGIESFAVPDVSLILEKPPVRLRSIEFSHDSCVFIEFNTGNRRVVPAEEIRLLVTGEMIESRTELKYKKKPKKDVRPDETITDSDCPILDIYTSRDDIGCRVQMNGFDFSGLGESKGMLAVENLRMLTVRLKDVSRECRVDTSYSSARPFLDRIWELETETDHLGIFAASFIAKEKTKVSTVNNHRQFTRYSRLQRLSI